MFSILYGFLAALTWGGGDFAGGLASRRVGAFVAVLLGEIAGLVVLIAAIPVVREPVPTRDVLLISGAAGAIGSFALTFFYRAMSEGQMSIAAPVSALLTAALPIVVGIFIEGLPSGWQLAGFAFALGAVWLISQADGDTRPHIERLADLRLPFIAGLGFGMYFVLIHQAARHAVLWPMIAGRIGGTLLIWIVVALRRDAVRVAPGAWKFILINGCFDIMGNLFYILAGQAGRLDVAAVISSLYPGATVFLAWLFLKERISRA
ncbi:MAG TPA: DMT family transporter [Anaerolineaceae bacterium]|nr:DMT family transporter [Anaerolineaceae bacterium]